MRAIVAGTDGSLEAESAVRRAAEIARGTGAKLHLVTVFPDIPSYREKLATTARSQPIDLRAAAETVLARAAREAEERGIEVDTHDRQGDPADEIIDVAREQNADLIVVGARGLSGIERFLLGSVSSKLSHHAPTSVMIVRGGT